MAPAGHPSLTVAGTAHKTHGNIYLYLTTYCEGYEMTGHRGAARRGGTQGQVHRGLVHRTSHPQGIGVPHPPGMRQVHQLGRPLIPQSRAVMETSSRPHGRLLS